MPQFVFRCLAMAVFSARCDSFRAADSGFRPLRQPRHDAVPPSVYRSAWSAIGRLRTRKSFRGKTPTTRCYASAAGALTCARARPATARQRRCGAHSPAAKDCRQGRASEAGGAQHHGSHHDRRNRDERRPRQRLIAAVIAAMLLGGCASTAVRENFGSAQAVHARAAWRRGALA